MRGFLKKSILTAVEHVLEVVPVDDLEERDVVVLAAVEGDDEQEVLVAVARLARRSRRLLHVHRRAQPLDRLGVQLSKQINVKNGL